MAEYAKKEILIKKLIEVADDFEQRGGIMNTAFAVSTKGIVDFLNDKDCSIFEEAKPVVHSHWKRKNNETKCSNCKFIYYSNHDDFNYCPNCGATMDGKENNNG